ncbi:MAG: putative 4-hydroxybenzoate polyprenyltransferase [Leptospiraceae bacterium]|nr:putative 4-hydroxybenzoate polyprenyltransferase [Leptospiraceae bacterium]MDW7975880.1 UbiA-like polyprenyltransferase [Leptospiraceae bacterium]
MKNSHSLMEILQNYLQMIKFSHTIFALPFAGIALVEILYWNYFKENHLQWSLQDTLIKTFGIIMCMITLRSAAMGFNRIVDRKFDALNPRTSNREIPSGKISLNEAYAFVLISSVLFILFAFLINPIAGFLSPIVVFLTFFYSFTKRFTFLCHYILGFAIGLAPMAVSVALLSKIELYTVLLSLALMFYIAGFDILYACQDYEFDQKMNLHSIPVKLGISKALIVARVNHVLSFLFLLGFYFTRSLNLIFLITILIVGFLFFFEHFLVRGGRLEKIPVAFFHVNSVISSVLFFGLLLDRWLFF